MTDETETPTPPRPVSVFTCINRRHPTRSCYLLVENTPETRQAHRQWHVDQETDREALRTAIKNRDETIARLREEISGYRRDVAGYTQEVQSFHGEVARVETPTIPPQLEIDRAGYTDDELDDEPAEPTPLADDPTLRAEEDPAEHSQYADDDDAERRRAAAASAAADPDDDDDDYVEPATVAHSVFGSERRF